MYNFMKYKEIEALNDISHERQLMARNIVKSFHQWYNIKPKIDIITKCEPFSNPWYPNCISICQGYFDIGLCLSMRKLFKFILNYLELALYQLTYNSYVCFWVLTKLDKHYGRGTINIENFVHYFCITKPIDYAHMYMIAKRAHTSLIFKNPNKT